MGFKAVEDRPTPKAVYNWRIYLAAVNISFGAMTFGYDSAFIGTTISRPGFKSRFGITAMTAAQQTATSSNLTSCFVAAAFFGALFAWPLMETRGRKITLQASAFIFMVGAILMTIADHQLSLIYAGRALTGLACGGITASVPTFISEIAPPAARGVMTGMFEISYQIGSVINYGVTHTIPLNSVPAFRIPMAVQLIPGGLLAIGTFFLLESPQFLLRAGKEEQALNNLCYLRMLPADHIYIQQEVTMVQARIADERALGGQGGMGNYLRGAFGQLKVPSIRNRVVITFFMFLFQNFSGAAAINYYSPTLFTSIGIKDVALYTGIYGLLKAFGSIVFFGFIVDRYGRRKAWLISASCCALCLLYVGIFVKIGAPAGRAVLSDSTAKGANAAIAMVMIYSVFWSFGGNGLPWIVSSEIFPLRLRSVTGSYAAMCQWSTQYACTRALPYMVLTFKTWGVFLFFAACCTITWIFTYVWVPETKGTPIESMGPLFDGRSRHCQFLQKKFYPPHGMPPSEFAGLVGEDGLVPHERKGGKEESFEEDVPSSHV